MKKNKINFKTLALLLLLAPNVYGVDQSVVVSNPVNDPATIISGDISGDTTSQIDFKSLTDQIKKTQSILYKLQRRIGAKNSVFTDSCELLPEIKKVVQILDEQTSNPQFYQQKDDILTMHMLTQQFVDFFIETIKIQKKSETSIDTILKNFKKTPISVACLEQLAKDNEFLENYANLYGRSKTQELIRKIEALNERWELFSKSKKVAKFTLGAAICAGSISLALYSFITKADKENDLAKALKENPILAKILSNSKLTFSLMMGGLAVEASKNADIFKLKDNYFNDAFKFAQKKYDELVEKIRKKYVSLGGTVEEKHTSGNKAGVPNYAFNDVSGLEEIKKELESSILNPISYGIKNDLPFRIPHGWLFKGISRSGKSFMAEALAGEIRKLLPNTLFWKISADEVRILGFHQIIDLAKNHNTPLVVFIDEIDLWNLNREGDKEKNRLHDLLINLSSLNETKNKKPVIVIGATNLVDSLDSALRQAGRFERELEFTYPTEDERLEFLTKILKDERIENLDELTVYAINTNLANQSFETVKNCVDKAIQLAESCAPKYEHFIAAIDSLVYCIKPHGINQFCEEDFKLCAVYQAGKSFMETRLNGIGTVARVTILPVLPRPETDCKDKTTLAKLGETFRRSTQKRCSETTNGILNEIKILVAGSLAQQIVLKDQDLKNNQKDLTKALELLIKLEANGINTAKLPSEILKECEVKAYQKLATIKEEVFNILTQDKEKIVEIAKFLLSKKTVDGQIIDQLAASAEQLAEQEKLQQLLEEQLKNTSSN
jgi:SpoVK/Ycf46/Vps4 family AAA+-type ATPase